MHFRHRRQLNYLSTRPQDWRSRGAYRMQLLSPANPGTFDRFGHLPRAEPVAIASDADRSRADQLPRATNHPANLLPNKKPACLMIVHRPELSVRAVPPKWIAPGLPLKLRSMKPSGPPNAPLPGNLLPDHSRQTDRPVHRR